MHGTLKEFEDNGVHYDMDVREMVPPLSSGEKHAVQILRPMGQDALSEKLEPIISGVLREHSGTTLDEALAKAKAELESYCRLN